MRNTSLYYLRIIAFSLLHLVAPANAQNAELTLKVADSTDLHNARYRDSTYYLNGLKHGRSVLYKNDELMLEQQWESGRLNGKSVIYRKGLILQIDNFTQGVLSDTSFEYSTEPVHFVHSKITYYTDGRRKIKIDYLRNQQMYTRWYYNSVSGIDSVFRYYSGNHIKSESRDVDKAIDPSGQTSGWNAIRNYYPSGILESAGLEKYTSKEGEWIYYDTTGRVLSRINYLSGEPHGWFTSYYPDGNVQLRTFCYKACTDTITVYRSDGDEILQSDSLYDAAIEGQQKLHYEIDFRNPNKFSQRNLNRSYLVYVLVLTEGGLPVTKQPSYPGGVDSLNAFFKRNIVYPRPEKSALLEGAVYIDFTVEADGSFTDIHGHGGGATGNWGLEKEALRVFRLMPNWTPAQYNGKNVRTTQTIVVNFYLNN